MVRPGLRLCIVGIVGKLANVLLVSAHHDGIPAVDAGNTPSAPPVAPLELGESCHSEIAACVGAQKVESLSASRDVFVGFNLARVLRSVVELLVHAIEKK